jgi:hypothetical protein
MNDAQVVNIARRIDTLNKKITELVLEIENSDHPNAAEIVDVLRDNGFDNPAYATHAVSHGLEHPEKWQTGYYDMRKTWGIRRKTKGGDE